VRAVEQPLRERILARRFGIVERAGQLANDGVDQQQRRQFAARDDEIAHRQLAIDLARKQPLVEAAEGTRVLRTERYSGNVYRSFTLPVELDETASEAKYENGVLKSFGPTEQ